MFFSTGKMVAIAGLGAALIGVMGCRKPVLSDNGVVGVFGETGLVWGQFSYPRAIAISPEGKIFVVDKAARVQRFDAQGRFEAGWMMPNWASGKPVGLTVHRDGRVFVADTHYSRVLVFDRDGKQLQSFGSNGTGPGQFQLVTDVAIDRDGFIYVSEYGGNDRISKFTPDLQFIRSFGNEAVGGEKLNRPNALAIDDEQTLWVADSCNHRIVRFSLDGEYLSSFGTVGVEPGQLRWPYGICACRDGSLLVCEFGNNRLQWFDRKGKSLRTWGMAGRMLGNLSSPWGAVESTDGLIYVLDSLNDRVQIIEKKRV